jgi:hypothetical protein
LFYATNPKIPAEISELELELELEIHRGSVVAVPA